MLRAHDTADWRCAFHCLPFARRYRWNAPKSNSNSKVRKEVACRNARCVSRRNVDLCAGCIEQGGGCGLSRGNGCRRLGRRPLDRGRAVGKGQEERAVAAEQRHRAAVGRSGHQGAGGQSAVRFRRDPEADFSAAVQPLRRRSAFRRPRRQRGARRSFDAARVSAPICR